MMKGNVNGGKLRICVGLLTLCLAGCFFAGCSCAGEENTGYSDMAQNNGNSNSADSGFSSQEGIQNNTNDTSIGEESGNTDDVNREGSSTSNSTGIVGEMVGDVVDGVENMINNVVNDIP